MRLPLLGHVSERRLADLANGTITRAELPPTEGRHLASCDVCGSLLEGHRRAERLLSAEWQMVPYEQMSSQIGEANPVLPRTTTGSLFGGGAGEARRMRLIPLAATVALAAIAGVLLWSGSDVRVGGPDPTESPAVSPPAAPTTFAEATPTPAPSPTPFAGPYLPEALAIAPDGRLYFADCAASRIFLVGAAGEAIVVAGTEQEGFSGDGGPATEARLHCPMGMAFDASGNLYVAVILSRRVRMIDTRGTITTIAGGTSFEDIGDGGPATEARLFASLDVALDAAGNLYISGLDDRIRRIDTEGIITTFAGTLSAGFSGDGGPADQAQLNDPAQIALDAAGNLHIADSGNNRVRRIALDGTITTIAGTGEEASSGDGGPATDAALAMPVGLAIDAAGNVYVAEALGNRVRRIDPDGIISTYAGTGEAGFAGDGGPAGDARLDFTYEPPGPWFGALALTIDAEGNLYIADTGNNRIRLVDSSGTITTFFDGTLP